MAKHGQENTSYGVGGMIDVLSDLLYVASEAVPKPKPKPAPKPDDKKTGK